MTPWDATAADAFLALSDPPEEQERKERLKTVMPENRVVMEKRIADITNVELEDALFDWYQGPDHGWGDYRDRVFPELTRMGAEAEQGHGPTRTPDTASDATFAESAITTASDGEPSKGSDPDGSQADRLVRLAADRYTLGISLEGDPYAVRKSGPNVAHLLRHAAGSLRSELAAEYYDRFDKTPSSSAVADAMAALEGFARRENPTELHIRMARDSNRSIWIDRGDPSGEAIHVSSSGWSIVESAPVVFRRTEATGIMPHPTKGGDPLLLGRIINVTEAQLRLIIAWLVASLIPDLPHPVLALLGIQGSGKSEAERVLVRLVDPSPAPLRTAPRDITDWVVAASGSWLVGLDNVSAIPDWMSDAICRGVTGDGLIRRRLYSDNSLVVTSFRRVILLNGIELGDIRGDLADRTLFLELLPITPDRRRTDRDLETAFCQLHSAILGGLLDLTVAVLAKLPEITLTSMPRMADFAAILAAVDAVTGWNTLSMFEDSQADQQHAVLEADEVASAVVTLMDGADGETTTEWTGTATELLQTLTTEDRTRKWPKTPSHLSGRLRRAVPALAAAGISVEWDKESDPKRRRLITVKRLGNGRPERPQRPDPNGVDGPDDQIPLSLPVED